VENSQTGIVTEYRNEKELVDAITLLIEDSAKAKKMGEKAKILCSQRFDIERAADQYIDIIRQLVSKG
jgi:glycosyltransferase involved in cell wall biosynthesis